MFIRHILNLHVQSDVLLSIFSKTNVPISSQFQPPSVRTSGCAFVISLRSCSSHASSSSSTDNTQNSNRPQEPQNQISDSSSGVSVTISHGLPQLTVPLPSRRELCRFTLRPVTHTVRDLISQLQHEDKGIDRVVVTTLDGVRIASSASIESLLNEDFELIINDVSYSVNVPFQKRITMEEMADMSDIRQLVNKLYAALNVDEHQILKEREILAHIEDIKAKLAPLEKKRNELVNAAERRTTLLAWSGLGYMAIQFGFLARLTWWEYSWDIMEPVTYFVTYGTAIAAYAYYVLTRQDFILPDVRDRQFLISFYKRAQKVGLNVQDYNTLKDRLSQMEGDINRLRDPFALNLPHTKLEQDPRCHDALTKAQLSIKSFLGLKSNK